MEKMDRGKMVVNSDECKGCGLCISQCPVGCIEFDKETINKQGYHPAKYKGSGCTACGICFNVCPEPGAITVYKLVKA